jgi:hypothetical protein
MLTHSATIIATGEDFRGSVYVALVCDSGETDEVQLLQGDGTSPLFTVDSPVDIDFRTYNLGKVQKIKVGLAIYLSVSYQQLSRVQMPSNKQMITVANCCLT